MRSVVAALVLGLGLLAAPAFAGDAKPAADAGSNYGALEQVPLTDDAIQNYIDSFADMQAAMGDAPADAAEPDSKTMAKLEAIAKKHGFKDFNDYNTVAGNISIVLDGIDPESKTYVGAGKLIGKSIAEMKADNQMKEADRKAALAELQEQQNALIPVKFQGNIDLVVKNYDKLTGAEQTPAK
jgi:hypothetical protein